MANPSPIQLAVNYTIYFTTQATYNAALNLITARVRNNPNQAFLAPANAAKIFNFVSGVNYNIPGNTLASMGMYGTAPFFLGLPVPGAPINNPNPTGLTMDGNVSSVTIPGTGGGPATILNWVATFVFIDQVLFQAPIPLRRFIAGFESVGDSSTGAPANGYSRDSSRTMDGVGLALRENINFNYLQSVTQYVTPSNPSLSWERVYIRVRNFGAAPIDIWKSQGFPSSGAGARLYLNPNGSIDIKNVTAGNVETLIGNSGVIFTQNQFLRLDIVVGYNALASGGGGQFTLFANQIQTNNLTILQSQGGLGGNSQTHTATLLGTNQAVSATGWEIDFDDWHNAEVPVFTINGITFQVIETPTIITIAGVQYMINPPPDFMNGTHIRLQKINSGTIGSFTGNLQSANQMMQPQFSPSTSDLTSTTSGDQIVATTDAIDTSDPLGTLLCACAALVTLYYEVAGGTPSHTVLGYSIGAQGSFTGNVTDSTSLTWKSILWPGILNNIQNPTIVPFVISLTKASNTSKITVNAFQSTVQYIGVWGLEDNSMTQLPRTYVTTNAWFPTVAQAFIGPPAGPVFAAAIGGTYTGNGTEQSIQIPFPINFLWIRPIGNNNPGVKWFGASLGVHRGDGSGAIRPDLIPRMDYNTPFNPSDVFTFTVVGTALENNQNGVTYQYIAIADPSFQFMLCGAWSHNSSETSKVNDLLDPNFAPLVCFFSFDRDDNDGTTRLIYKGVGHTGSNSNKIDGTALTNSGSFSTGSITSGTDNQNADKNQVNYAAFNQTNDCSGVMIQAASYVGTGASSLVVNLTPTTGRYPLLVYVQPHNAAGFVLDPSDVAPSSRNIVNGTPSNTGITAVGMDSITVGATLNGNGVTYDVFVILGDTAGFNNGEFIAAPCQPDSLVPTPGTVNINAIVITPVGGIEFNGSTALTLLKDVSGIYQLIKGQTHDELLDRQPNQVIVPIAIPASFKTGYIGG